MLIPFTATWWALTACGAPHPVIAATFVTAVTQFARYQGSADRVKMHERRKLLRKAKLRGLTVFVGFSAIAAIAAFALFGGRKKS